MPPYAVIRNSKADVVPATATVTPNDRAKPRAPRLAAI